MNEVLADVLRQLHLKPGTYHCEPPEHEVVVQVRLRKSWEGTSSLDTQSEKMTAEPAIIDESYIMLDSWVELPEPSGGFLALSHLGEPELPDPQILPTGDEMDLPDAPYIVSEAKEE